MSETNDLVKGGLYNDGVYRSEYWVRCTASPKAYTTMVGQVVTRVLLTLMIRQRVAMVLRSWPRVGRNGIANLMSQRVAMVLRSWLRVGIAQNTWAMDGNG